MSSSCSGETASAKRYIRSRQVQKLSLPLLALRYSVTRVPRAAGPLIAGMPNLHSHAFQRAFAGLSEYRSAGNANDSFWTWRDLMYRFAQAVSPEQLEDIATHLYIEMLQAGYTSVCEFHYLHHGASGQPYGDIAEMSMRLLAAAQRAGIGITLLLVRLCHDRSS